MHGLKAVLAPGGPAMDLAQRWRQHVAVEWRAQQALAEPYRQRLPSLLQRDGVESPQGLLVGSISMPQDDPEAALLDHPGFRSSLVRSSLAVSCCVMPECHTGAAYSRPVRMYHWLGWPKIWQ